MSKDAKRRFIILLGTGIICIVALLLAGIFTDTLRPEAYEYYINNVKSETGMLNAVTAIYLRYRIFDTLFEALLLAVAVSVVVYFASGWKKRKGESENE